MKKILSLIVFVCLLYSSAFSSDWKNLANATIEMSADAISNLENKKDKSAQDVYSLTIIYNREGNLDKLQTMFNDNEKNMPNSPALRLLEGIILMREHKYEESRDILKGVMTTHPDFYPALVTLSYLNYLQKDFAQTYAIAKQLIAKKTELSRYHYVGSLLLAAGSKGIMAKNSLFNAIFAYFEVNGYFEEAQQLMPDSSEVLYATGSYYLVTPAIAGGDLDKAIGLLEKSRQLAPLNTQVYVRLAQAYRNRGDAVAFQQNIARASELDPQDELLLDYISDEKKFLDIP